MSDDTKLRHTVLHRSLHRPNLVMNGEREFVLMSLVIAGGLAITSLNLVGIVTGVAIWIVSLATARTMAKADPQLTKVYTRHLRYSAHYTAKSTPWGFVWAPSR